MPLSASATVREIAVESLSTVFEPLDNILFPRGVELERCTCEGRDGGR